MGVFEGTDVVVGVHLSGAPQSSDELSVWSEHPLPANQTTRCDCPLHTPQLFPCLAWPPYPTLPAPCTTPTLVALCWFARLAADAQAAITTADSAALWLAPNPTFPPAQPAISSQLYMLC